jgi:hypothetical protein
VLTVECCNAEKWAGQNGHALALEGTINNMFRNCVIKKKKLIVVLLNGIALLWPKKKNPPYCRQKGTCVWLWEDSVLKTVQD